jgi:hypothetical protein
MTYLWRLVFAPRGAVFLSLLVILGYILLESDDDIEASGKLNEYLLVLFSCLALLPDPETV